MLIGVTGSDGLIGYHARCCLLALNGKHEVRIANRETFSNPSNLDSFVKNLDAIFHFAGVNRGDDDLVENENINISKKLIDALTRNDSRPSIVYANSTHKTRDTAYGRGKRIAGELLEEWGGAVNAKILNAVLPHIFGEFGKPFYNSAVSTFCHQLASGDSPNIDIDGNLELLHAQDAIFKFIDWIENPQAGTKYPNFDGEHMLVSEMLEKLQALMVRYSEEGVIPNLLNPIDLRLFNTLRSYLYDSSFYPRKLKLHQDNRGNLFEAIKADQGGQVFLSSTLPSITRGNHWHLKKIERFLVVGGSGAIRIRRLFTDEVLSFNVDGNEPAYIDIPTMHTHSITNIGDTTMQTLFWSNEIFDPANPDTYPEAVIT
jgi:UDP-2-acetamido-2,6-beta-L-arabino-hexul-4-ose reductase